MTYNPNDWLPSATRELRSYIAANAGRTVDVKMDFPEPADLAEKIPFDSPIIHIHTDDIEHPTLGMGIPGKDVVTEIAPGELEYVLEAAQVHFINYDVGVWVDTKNGGGTARMQLVAALTNMLVPPLAKQILNDTTGGIWVRSFTGGRFALDRIADQPVWRAMDMTLIVRVVSRHVPPTPSVVPQDFDQVQDLTISDDNGTQVPVT